MQFQPGVVEIQSRKYLRKISKTISFASYIKKIKEQRFRDLQEEIATLEKNVTENSMENLETKKHELESLRNETRGSQEPVSFTW